MAVKNIYKHLMNFTSKSHRPVLTGFHFTDDGDIEATNSHIYAKLHRVVPPLMEDFILCPKTLRKIEGTYPDCGRLIPQTFESQTAITSETAKDVAKWTKALGKNEIVHLTFEGTKLELSAANTRATFLLAEDCDELSLMVMAGNLQIVCEFMADVAIDVALFQVGLNGPLKAIRFYIKDVYDLLLTPVRAKEY